MKWITEQMDLKASRGWKKEIGCIGGCTFGQDDPFKEKT